MAYRTQATNDEALTDLRDTLAGNRRNEHYGSLALQVLNIDPDVSYTSREDTKARRRTGFLPEPANRRFLNERLWRSHRRWPFDPSLRVLRGFA
jgi:hypothetical protein